MKAICKRIQFVYLGYTALTIVEKTVPYITLIYAFIYLVDICKFILVRNSPRFYMCRFCIRGHFQLSCLVSIFRICSYL